MQRCLYKEFDCTAEYNAINNYRAGMGLASYNVYTDGPFHDYVLIRAIEVAYNFDHSSPCYWAYPKYMNVVIPEESHHAPDMPFNSFYDERTTGRSEVEIFWI